MRALKVILLVLFFTGPAIAEPVEIEFATDWKAQAEHGGFYQALALGLYEKRGLLVRFRMGGPQVDVPRLMAAGAIDVGMGSNSFQPLNLALAGADVKAVAAFFQKDPQVLMTHPDDVLADLADLKGKPILLADSAINTVWPWMRNRFGLKDRQIRKYTYSLAPWLVSPGAVQEGYLSSEPFTAAQAGVKANVYLLADYGYPGYAAMVMMTGKFLKERPDAARGFVQASIEGWNQYLNGDPEPANALIRAANPEMTDALLAFGREAMKREGIVESGDAERYGIGTMTAARWKTFAHDMIGLDLFPSEFDVQAAYTLDLLESVQRVAPDQ